MNQIPNIEERCEHGVVAKYCFRCKRPDLAGPIPNIEENSKEEFLHLLHQVVQHTPLKIEETAGTDYDRGYIFYQDMVLRDVEELETTMWDWHHHQLQKARLRGYGLAVKHLKEAYTANGATTVPEAIEWLEDNLRLSHSELDQDKV